MQMRAPKNKTEYYRRWNAMEFGNRTQSWNNGYEMSKSGYVGPVGLRYLIPGRKMILPEPSWTERAMSWPGPVSESPGKYDAAGQFQETRIIQGYLCRTDRGLEFRYDDTGEARGCNMVEEFGHNVCGLTAHMILKHYVEMYDPASYEDLMLLLERYEGECCIEFSVFGRPCGLLNRPTIIWEVRGY